MAKIIPHGSGKFKKSDFKKIGKNVVIEPGVLVFHPENIEIGDNVYIGHQTILKGYHKNKMIIGSGSWIGQQCFFHSAGGLEIEENVGIAPGVTILTSIHDLAKDNLGCIIDLPLKLAKVSIGSGSDVGAKTIILPGITLGRGVQVGAGAVVTNSFKENSIIAGVPAKLLRKRKRSGGKKTDG